MSKQVALKDVRFHFKCKKCGDECTKKSVTLPLICPCGTMLIDRLSNVPAPMSEENQFAALADQMEKLGAISNSRFDFSLSV